MQSNLQFGTRRARISLVQLLNSFVLVMLVAIINRGVIAKSFYGNQDVLGHVAQVTHRSSPELFFGGYSFLEALGVRLLERAHILNPISIAQYLVGPDDALWVSPTIVLTTCLICLRRLQRQLNTSFAFSSIASFFMSIWLLIPSPFRVGSQIMFGGHPLAFALIATFVVALLTEWERKADLRNFGIVTTALSLLLIGSQQAQPIVLYAISFVVISQAITDVFTDGAKSAGRRLAYMLSATITALLGSSLLVGTPLLTVLSSSVVRGVDLRGVSGDGFIKSYLPVAWSLGGASEIRLVVGISIVSMFLLVRRRLTSKQKQWVQTVLVLALLIQTYALVYLGFLRVLNIEIGPRPMYLAENVFVPLFSTVVGLLLPMSLSTVWVRLRLSSRHLREWRTATLSLLVPFILPLGYLGQWSVRNPDDARAGWNLREPISLTSRLSWDSRLSELSAARVLVIDRGEELFGGYKPEGTWHWVVNRQRPPGVVVFADYSYGLTRWQHEYFERNCGGGQRLLATFLFCREYSTQLALTLGVTHVISDRPLLDSSLRLMDYGDPRIDGFMYKVARENLNQRQTTSRFAEDGSAFLLVTAPSHQTGEDVSVSADKTDSSYRQSLAQVDWDTDVIRLRANSLKPSTVVLPIEFSRCHKLTVSDSGTSSLRLAPVSERFLGLRFVGSIDVRISYRVFGPFGLLCQIRDFIDSRRLD